MDRQHDEAKVAELPEYLALKHLAERGETHGLAIAQATEFKPGTIYPVLRRLESQGLVCSWREDIDEHAAGRRRRRYWRITAAGRAAVDATNVWLRSAT
jgi:DNA-binding PadR family transcriptional regulator